MRRGFYPALFEQLGMPSTGLGRVHAVRDARQGLTKKIVAGYGVPIPRGRLITRDTLRAGGLDDLIFPVIVKPNYEGSSKGITQSSIVDEPIELARVIEDMLPTYPEGLLVEQYIAGVDVAACFLEGLPPLERIMTPVECVVDPPTTRVHAIYDYELKHDARGTRHAPRSPRAPDVVLEKIRAMSERVASRRSGCAMPPRSTCASLPTARCGSCRAPRCRRSIPAARSSPPARATVSATPRRCWRRSNRPRSAPGSAPQLEATKPRSRSKRSLKVGFAFNMKRLDTSVERHAKPSTTRRAPSRPSRKAIEGYGHQVVPLEATGDFPRALMTSGVDIVFNMAEGIRGRNREAQVPSLCELLGIPYTGSDPATLSLCLDKGLGKRILREQGIDTPAFQVLVTGREKLRTFRYPVIVKPNAEGTSKGITKNSVVDDEAGVRAAARELIDRYDQPALVEEYIIGREFTVGLLGEKRPARAAGDGGHLPALRRTPGLRLRVQAGLGEARSLRMPRQAHAKKKSAPSSASAARPSWRSAAATSPASICAWPPTAGCGSSR